MATVVLGAAAGKVAASAAFGGTFGAFTSLAAVGLSVGARVAGRALDREFGINQRERNIEGRQLSNLQVQSSAYGDTIKQVYGTARIAGNIIWAEPIKETETVFTSTSSGGGKGGGGSTVRNETVYSYSVTLAIAICEGEIDNVLRVWADSDLIDPRQFASNYTLYKGGEDQLPDSVMEAALGVGNVPAYRGLAYVVIQDFPLEDYGNRIPNFTFEVQRKLLSSDTDGQPVEEKITAITMIPASGEFAYDTAVQYKLTGETVGGEFVENDFRTRINQANADNKANALVSLDQLEATCPNIEWVSVIVGWFGDSIDAGACTILPGVEFKSGATTSPDSWQVAGFTRDTAKQITLIDGNPVYGGTPDDDSILRYLDELIARGKKIVFYPFVFMDTPDKPWRGRITGSPADVASFFTKANGFNDFITHYAQLVKDKIDAFIIGSEMIGLTTVQDSSDDSFPAVDALVNLAATVKGIVGANVKVSYAADWSEYHSTNGWYQLDPLWASADIDFVAIDAYFPLTNAPQNEIMRQDIIDGWTSGEGYDFYYTDSERTTTAPLDPAYAWKNLDWWWNHTHTNPDSVTTGWVPQSKPIWFTEFGFPSVDGCSNQPNVFYDPASSESNFPRFSQGITDFFAQRQAISATMEVWQDSPMVEELFLWTWDARPFPFWPDLREVWSDGNLWDKGHWVNGKFGLSTLGAVVQQLALEAGLSADKVDISDLTQLVNGYVINVQQTAVEAIEELQRAYFFDAVERDGRIVFVRRSKDVGLILLEEALLGGEDSLQAKRSYEAPYFVDVAYLNKSFSYQVGSQHAQRNDFTNQQKLTVNIPVVLTNQEGYTIAHQTLYRAIANETAHQFHLPLHYAYLEPADQLELVREGETTRLRVIRTEYEEDKIRVIAVAESTELYEPLPDNDFGEGEAAIVASPGETKAEIIELPPLPGNALYASPTYAAVRGVESAWNGAVVYRSDDNGESYQALQAITLPQSVGKATSVLAAGASERIDRVNTVNVTLEQGELESVSELAMLNGANAALLGDELIQYQTATLIGTNSYTLSHLLRGRQGTEHAISSHALNERFIPLSRNLPVLSDAADAIDIARLYKPVTVGSTLQATAAQSFTNTGRALKPFAPVHVRGVRDGAGNLTISWVRRARINGGWKNNVEIPLDELEERYLVDIYNGAVLLRRIEVTNPEAVYSAAEQTADFGAPQAAISLRVYQWSHIVGKGHTAAAVL